MTSNRLWPELKYPNGAGTSQQATSEQDNSIGSSFHTPQLPRRSCKRIRTSSRAYALEIIPAGRCDPRMTASQREPHTQHDGTNSQCPCRTEDQDTEVHSLVVAWHLKSQQTNPQMENMGDQRHQCLRRSSRNKHQHILGICLAVCKMAPPSIAIVGGHLHPLANGQGIDAPLGPLPISGMYCIVHYNRHER